MDIDPPVMDVEEPNRPEGFQRTTLTLNLKDSREFSMRMKFPSLTVNCKYQATSVSKSR